MFSHQVRHIRGEQSKTENAKIVDHVVYLTFLLIKTKTLISGHRVLRLCMHLHNMQIASFRIMCLIMISDVLFHTFLANRIKAIEPSLDF